MAAHATVNPALAPEIAREAAGEAVLISASPTLTQTVKFATEVGRNIMMTMSISYRRAGDVVGIETTAIPGMSYMIRVVAEGTLAANGGVQWKNQFRARSAMEHLRIMSL
jgi:hypothetical protein